MCKFVLHDSEGIDSLTVELKPEAKKALFMLLEVNDPTKTSRDIFMLSNQLGYISHLLHEINTRNKLEPYWVSTEARDSILTLVDIYNFFNNITVKHLEA